MLGSVEYRDLWLIEVAVDSSLLPRGNFNVAMDAFSAALRLQPAFDLGPRPTFSGTAPTVGRLRAGRTKTP